MELRGKYEAAGMVARRKYRERTGLVAGRI
jgi:hypothetical protein